MTQFVKAQKKTAATAVKRVTTLVIRIPSLSHHKNNHNIRHRLILRYIPPTSPRLRPQKSSENTQEYDPSYICVLRHIPGSARARRIQY